MKVRDVIAALNEMDPNLEVKTHRWVGRTGPGHTEFFPVERIGKASEAWDGDPIPEYVAIV